MKSSDALLEAWEKTVGQGANQPAIIAPSGEILQTFAGIESRAHEFEAKLDFAAGSVIAIQIGNHPDWPALFLACLQRGLVTLPLDESMTDQRRRVAFETCGVAAAAIPAGDREIQILPTGTSVATTTWDGAKPSLLKLTSGTTAAPRAIRFRSQQLLADCTHICETMGISEADLNFGVIPISHSYGFSNLLTPLIARGVPMVVSNDRTPRAVLEGLEQTKATVLPATPVFYQAFCKIENTPTLPHLRLCVSAGAPLSAATARAFRKKFQVAVHSFYGASECGGICYDREGKAESEGFVGGPMKSVALDPIDSAGSSTQMRVRSAAAGDGYFPSPDPDKLGNGTFIPDDLLEPVGDGFKIVGRVSELINVAGKKVNPAEIEAHLRRCPGVREAVVFGRKSDRRNEEIAACVVAEADITEQAVLEFARKSLSPWQVPKRLFFVSEIPANERGKVSRRELARRYSE